MLTTLCSLSLSLGLAITGVAQDAASQAPATEPATQSADAPVEVTPAMFVARDEDTTVFLFGSFHLLPQNVDWRSEAFDAAYEEADAIYFEVAMTPVAMIQAQANMLKMGRLPEGESLMDDLTEKERATFERLAADSGLPAEQLARFNPATASILLAQTLYNELDLKPNYGVELTLAADILGKQRDLRGLETIDEQSDILFAMPEEIGMVMLKSMLEESVDDQVVELRKVYDAWSSGNMDQILDITDDMAEESEALYDRLIVDRNKAWVEELDALMDEQAGTFLVVVGAGHLPGEEGVVALLKAKGQDVERVQ